MSEFEAYNLHSTIVSQVNCLLENMPTEKTMKICKMLNAKFHAKFKLQAKDHGHGGLAAFLFLHIQV